MPSDTTSSDDLIPDLAEPECRSSPAISLLDAELVALGVGHDDMFGSWFPDLPENRGAELPEPGDLAVAVV